MGSRRGRWGWGGALLAAGVAWTGIAQASPAGEAEALLLMQLSRTQGALDLGPASGPATFAAVPSRAVPTLPERRALEPLAVAAAQQYGVSVDFFKRLIRQESGYNPNAVSVAGAQGIAQFMPATAAMVGLDDPFNPTKALPKSAEHLADLKRRLGNEGLAAAAYNAGEGRVRAWLAGRVGLPVETQNYVRSITGRSAHDWAPAGSLALPTVGAPVLSSLRTPIFARYQSAEWQVGVKLMGDQNRLVGLLEMAGAGQARRGREVSASRRSAAPVAMTGEKALCASMGRGCIVASVY